MEKLEDCSQKRGALWCKGHQSIITLCARPLGSIDALITRQGSALLQKTQEKFQKLKNSREFSQSG
jgi:hypothetical protein